MDFLVIVKIACVFLFTPFVTYTIDIFRGEGMIFEFYDKWLQTIPEKIAKPLGLCPNCFNVWLNVLMLLTMFTMPTIAILIFGFSFSNYLLKIIYK